MAARESTTNSRATAARIVARWLSGGVFPDRLLGDVAADRAVVMEMVYGIAKWKRSLTWALRRCVPRGLDPHALPFLLVGSYQILLMDDVPAYAAVSETVEASKSVSRSCSRFVNAVLRRVWRERVAILEALAGAPLALGESHPDELVDRWVQRFGADKAADLCRWNNRRARLIVRANLAVTSPSDLAAAFETAGVVAEGHPYRPDECLVVSHGTRVTDLPGYREGRFSVQDPSTLAAVDLLDPRPGERVLDACAAPGGKTAVVAEKMRGNGYLLAVDARGDRLDTLSENLARMGHTEVACRCADATRALSETFAERNSFDRILLDVPCTNTGVLQRRPDARWRFSMHRLESLQRTQRGLLDRMLHYVKPGGIIVYSTCSLEPEEGEQLVESWCGAVGHVECIRSVSLFPPDTQTDGAYAALLRVHPV